MTDNFKSDLLDLINKAEDRVSELFHELENDSTISDESFHNAEKYIDSLFVLLNKMREEVVFSL
jgi:hypothetical protein